MADSIQVIEDRGVSSMLTFSSEDFKQPVEPLLSKQNCRDTARKCFSIEHYSGDHCCFRQMVRKT